MKRILHTVLMLTMAVAMFAQSYPRKVTEEDIPSSERNKYFEQVENNIHNFYMLLLDLSDREMREEFISEIFMDNSNRHIPEFYLLDKKDQRLSPGQYLIELDKVISSFDRDGLDFQIENISHQPDMFMMNMRSCYVHSEYDLTLKDNGKVVFKRRCRITSFFPKASSYIRVKTMQVEPVRDIIAYKKPVTQTVVADNNQTTKKVKVSGIKVRECTESEIPYSRRAKYYDEAHRVVQDFYMLLLETVGNTDNRDVVIDQLINDKQATTLKTDFLLTQDHNLTFCSPMQYFTKFEAVYKDMVEEVEFLVDNFTDGKIMMNSLVSCYIPVEYDLTLTKGDEILFKRRCRMYCFFPKVSADKLVKVIQVEPVRDIIAYKKPVTQTVVADNNQTTKKVKVSGVITEKSNLDDIFKSNREGEYFEQIKAKAEQGDLHAQCKLGDLYMVGWPLSDKQYHRIAFEWYNKAAGQGSIEAMLNLGECYDKGIGVNKDYKIAFEYYEKASKYYESAQIETAICYYQGKGVTQSYQKAFKCFDKVIHKKCDRKNPYHQKAAYFLGLMHEYGQGMDVNLYKALIYYEKCGLYKDAPDRIQFINSHNKDVKESFNKKNSNHGDNIAEGTVMYIENNEEIYIPSVVVWNLNTGNFVQTDKNGTFKIDKVKEGDILCFYYNGHNIHYEEWVEDLNKGNLYIIIGKANEHIVKDGETIEQICSKYDISIHQLINHNIGFLVEKDIKVGQKLFIPWKGTRIE